MKNYEIPAILIEEFLKVSSNNISSKDNLHVETLAFLIGTSNEETATATHLIFPRQNGGASHVNDEGKYDFGIVKIFGKIQVHF